MKKLFLSLMLIVLTFTLVACGNGDKKETYTVTFNSNGGSSVASKVVDKDAKVAKPANPTKANYEFVAWFEDSALTDEWDFNVDVVTKNITLYAKYEEVVTTIAVSELEKFIKSTRSNYEDTLSASLLITIKDGDLTSTLEYVYNLNNPSEIKDLMLKFVAGDQVMEAYVKDGWDYVNIAGEKTKALVGYDTADALLNEYGFNEMTESVFNALDANIFNACSVKTDENGVATLEWNKASYDNIIEEEDPDKLFELLARVQQIKENINSINISVSYANKKVTKIESTWVNKDNVTKQLNIEFRSLDPQTITFPTDLDSYVVR